MESVDALYLKFHQFTSSPFSLVKSIFLFPAELNLSRLMSRPYDEYLFQESVSISSTEYIVQSIYGHLNEMGIKHNDKSGRGTIT